MNSAGESTMSSSAAPPVPIPLIVQVFDHPINRKPIFHMANSDTRHPEHHHTRWSVVLSASTHLNFYLYLDEFTFRFNRRHAQPRLLWYRLLEQGATTHHTHTRRC